ncbi:MAG: SRPBCC family protein [Rhodobacteraceae bacterium]|jgi:hypothetical protein|nr:SRPBCC family protein [Paracoccaceae bacterium]
MWQHVHEKTTDIPREAIWDVIADIARWPEVDRNIDRLTINAPPAPGVPFTLKPRGGPSLRFTIGRFDPPGAYSDICRMPGAVMETRHLLLPGARTTVRVEIQITGPMAWFWGRTVGRKHAQGLPAQTARILAAARRAAVAA